jgi:hypothetical protein
MPIRGRGSIRLPFLRINWTRHGLFGLPRITSTTTHFGPWSRNSRTRKHRVDLPGPHHWYQSKGKK